MDPHSPEGQQIESAEATIALTRELIARSRATLDTVARQLAGGPALDDSPALAYLGNAEREAG